jgi:hypothetical protein
MRKNNTKENKRFFKNGKKKLALKPTKNAECLTCLLVGKKL